MAPMPGAVAKAAMGSEWNKIVVSGLRFTVFGLLTQEQTMPQLTKNRKLHASNKIRENWQPTD